MNFLGDVSSDPVGAGSHLLETSFFLSLIWSLYPATFGQAIPSAFGLFRLAETVSIAEEKKHHKTFLVFPTSFSYYGD